MSYHTATHQHHDDGLTSFSRGAMGSNNTPRRTAESTTTRQDTITAAANNNNNESTTPYVSMDTEMGEKDGIMKMGPSNNNNDQDDDDDDEDVDLPGDISSIASSVLTADGIHDYPGFLCVCMVILIGDMSRGVMFPSMWPLVQSLNGSKVMLGYSVAAFSFGRVLMNPVFGTWSHQFGYTKTLFIACTILLAGTVAYAQIQNVGRVEFLIVAQTLLGLGSGTLGVTRAFVADVTARRNRTKYMALITAVQYGGFTVTPAFGALFNKILGDNSYKLLGIPWLRLNMYTAPAYFMTAIVLLTMSLMSVHFQNRHRYHVATDATKKKTARRQAIDQVANQMTFVQLTVYDCCMVGCMLLNIATKGNIACFETLGVAIAQENFDMMASRAGIIIALCGVVGVINLLNMGVLEQRYTDVQIIIGGMITMIIGICFLCFIDNHDENNPTWIYVVAMMLLYGFGYPIGHTAVIGLFSKSEFFCDRVDWIVEMDRFMECLAHSSFIFHC